MDTDRSQSSWRAELRNRFGPTQMGRTAPRELAATPSWTWPELAGRLCEISGARGGALTLALRLVHDAQRRGETVVWVGERSSSFFPPDAAAGGVDLDSLVVVHSTVPNFGPRAADFLMRSGAFGLVVLESSGGDVPQALQSRWLAAAQRHDVVLLIVGEKPRGARSLGSLISLYGEVEVARANSDDDGDFLCTLTVTKDKRRAPGWRHVEVCRGPVGLR